MVQAVADGFGDDGLRRDARELLFEPDFESQHERLALFLAHGTALVGRSAADRLLNRVEKSDAIEGFARDGCGAALGDFEELSSQMCPAEGERDGFAEICCVGNVLVGRVSIALHDAMIGIEQLQRVDGAAARRIGVGDGGRVGSTPGPVIAGDRPEVSLLGASPAGIEHRRHRLIDRDLERAQNEFTQPKIKRLQLRGGITDPERQCGALDRDALAQQNLSLAIERQVPGIFGCQDIGHHRLGRQPALDQPLGRRRLDGRLFAGPAGIFGTMCDDHAELGRDHVQPLRRLLADHMHGRPAARAVRIFGSNRYIHPRQMTR